MLLSALSRPATEGHHAQPAAGAAMSYWGEQLLVGTLYYLLCLCVCLHWERVEGGYKRRKSKYKKGENERVR